jgi:hypothetical protein
MRIRFPHHHRQDAAHSAFAADGEEALARRGTILAYLKKVWSGLRENRPVALPQEQATALAGDLYRAWAAGEKRGRTRGMVRIPVDEIPEGEGAKQWDAAFAAIVLDVS